MSKIRSKIKFEFAIIGAGLFKELYEKNKWSNRNETKPYRERSAFSLEFCINLFICWSYFLSKMRLKIKLQLTLIDDTLFKEL